MGRFENVKSKQSKKKMVTCDAATSEYLRHDFLKPQHLPVESIDHEANLATTSNMHETRFHKGFQRRHQSDIQQDAARMESEMARDQLRDMRSQASVEAAFEHRDKHTFNLLSGEGVGRECEFRQVGKKIVNPFGCMEATFGEHQRDMTNRVKNSKHRFFEYPAPQKVDRTATIFKEGLTETTRQSAVLGYGPSGVRRSRAQSCGVADNYVHLRALPAEPEYETPHYGNRSQIILG